jgi:anthranilate synthase
VAAYHSLLVDENNIPESELRVQATNDNGQIMAVEHNRKLIMGVQFHPESILSMHHDVGWRMIENVCRMVMRHYQ